MESHGTKTDSTSIEFPATHTLGSGEIGALAEERR